MKRFSLFLSYAFCIAGFAVVLSMCISLPILGMQKIATVPAALQFARLNYPLSYLILSLVLLSDVCLFLLLRQVRCNQIFTARSCILIRIISWSAIFAGFFAVPLFFTFIREALFIAFVALFLGVVLRVVGQVIRKATELKEENDATI